MGKLSQLHADLEQARALGFDALHELNQVERDLSEVYANLTIVGCAFLGLALIGCAVVSSLT